MRRSAGSANVPAGKLLPTPGEDVGALKVSRKFRRGGEAWDWGDGAV